MGNTVDERDERSKKNRNITLAANIDDNDIQSQSQLMKQDILIINK